MTVEHAAQPAQLPGYSETMRLVQGVSGVGMFRPAFSKLEIMSVAAALDFIKPKITAATDMKDADRQKEALTEIVLGFAVMCVFADRENTAYLEEMDQRAARARETREIDQDIEKEHTDPAPDIQW